MKSYFQYWGKTNQRGEEEKRLEVHLLPYHLLDVAACGEVLLEKSPRLLAYFSTQMGMSFDNAKRFLVFMLALHDVGKFSHRFQSLSPEAMNALGLECPSGNYNPRHDTAGYIAYHDFLSPLLTSALGLSEINHHKESLSTVARAIFGHHGKPPIEADVPNPFESAQQKAALLFFSECFDLFDVKNLQWPEFTEEIEDNFKNLSWTIAGFAVASDWFGSASEIFEYQIEEEPLTNYWEKTKNRAEKIVRDSGVLPEPVRKDIRFSSVFPNISTPRPMQKFADNTKIPSVPAMYIIEDATGSGKTEAAVVLAGRMMSAGLADGIYIGLPTMATANQMYERVTEFYRALYDTDSQPSVVLAHGKKRFNDTFNRSVSFGKRMSNPVELTHDNPSEAICKTWVGDSNRKALLASVGIGTIDQAMLSILQVKFQSLRLLGLFGKILIVDEVHAYDTYMSNIILELITFHASRGGSLILLSATLPSSIRKQLVCAFRKGRGLEFDIPNSNTYPLVTSVGTEAVLHEDISAAKGRDQSHKLVLLDDENDVIKEILGAVYEGKCVCWIRNTVRDAIDAFDRLEQEVDLEDLQLFHARFALQDRQEIEKDILMRFGKKSNSDQRKGRIVIATQVIEQSLDVDFDLLVSDLAPIDLLIQRAGRQHRHARKRNGDSNIDGSDLRESPRFVIFGPKYTSTPTELWHKAAAPGSAAVYGDTRIVFKTAQILAEKTHLRIPADSRSLVENVYGDKDDVPDAIEAATTRFRAEDRVQKSVAGFAVLNWSPGYRDGEQWSDDLRFSTRLGPPTEKIRLLKRKGAHFEPYADSGANIFENYMLSELNMRAGWFNKNVELSPEVANTIEDIRTTMHDGEFVKLLPVENLYDKRRGLL